MKTTRRDFLKRSLTGVTAISILPSLYGAGVARHTGPEKRKHLKLRFAIASDGHYAQEGTDFKKFFEDIVKWLNEDHAQYHLDFAIINGDLVHDRTDLLTEVKQQYFDHFHFPYYTVQGNHDRATPKAWKSIWGHDDNFVFAYDDVGFILANTSNTKGEYLCPDNIWLRSSLEGFKSKKTVFVVLHIPPHKWLNEPYFAECDETLAILHNYPNLTAAFHGHDHSLDSVRYSEKLPHLFDGHFGGSWGTDYKGYRVVEIDKSDHVYTYQVNASKSPIINSLSLQKG